MDKDYNKFLLAKLYLIESLSRKYLFAGNKEMKEILELCIAGYSEIKERLANQHEF